MFIRSYHFGVEFLGFSILKILSKNHVVYKQKQFQLFPTFMPFIYLSCLIDLLGFLELCWAGMVSYLSLPDLGETLSITHHWVCSRWRHVTMCFIMLRWSPSTLVNSCHIWMLNLLNAFCAFIERIMDFLHFIILKQCIASIDQPACISRMNPTRSRVWSFYVHNFIC